MKISPRFFLTLCLTAMFASRPAHADVRLPAFFSDHMVLQRDRPVPVWGWAAAGESVTVRLGGQSRSAAADAGGGWSMTFDPLPATAADAPALMLEIKGRNRLVVQDVLVGEVWLCSGQSNMEWIVADVVDAASEIAAADHPRIRQFEVPRVGMPEPQDSSFIKETPWQPASPGTVGKFTAVGYFFAREISRALGGVPVGLLNASWGGTAIQSWMSVEALRAAPGRYEALLKAKEKEFADWPARLRQIEADTQAWEKRAAEAHAAGQPEPPKKPWNPGPPNLPQWTPANLYNGMIHPLIPLALRGVLWYQGESNAGFGEHGAADYTSLQTDMIHAWRAAWNAGDFPFYYVQLPNYESGVSSGVSWAWFRDGQRRILDAVPNTGMAVTVDLGESDNIHPHNKKPVGERLARIALRHTYGQPIVDQGPTFRAMTPEGASGSVRLAFDHAEDGLVARDGAPKYFELAGPDKQFHPAGAVVQGSEIVLSCPQVTAPAAVRYAWSDDPVGCNLFNKDGLPAVPFNTDAGVK